MSATIYAFRPVLSVTSLTTSDQHGVYGAKVSITNTGMKMTDVKVKCVTNKVIFQERNTFELNKFIVLNEYSVPDVRSGESFTGDCNFAWSLWTTQSRGILIFGAGASGTPQITVPFLLTSPGEPAFIPSVSLPYYTSPDLTGYSYNQVTEVDGIFIVEYSWPLTWFSQQRIIHMIAQRAAVSEELKWRVAPESEPVIPNARLNGFRIIANGNAKKWSVELTPGIPPQ